MRPITILALGMALLALSGCGSIFPYPVQATTPYPGYGNATVHNAAVHVIDPIPPGAADTRLEFDGYRAALAISRYQADKVKPPRELRTSDVGDSGGQ